MYYRDHPKRTFSVYIIIIIIRRYYRCTLYMAAPTCIIYNSNNTYYYYYDDNDDKKADDDFPLTSTSRHIITFVLARIYNIIYYVCVVLVFPRLRNTRGSDDVSSINQRREIFRTRYTGAAAAPIRSIYTINRFT